MSEPLCRHDLPRSTCAQCFNEFSIPVDAYLDALKEPIKIHRLLDTKAEPVEKLLAEASELAGELRGKADRVARYSSKPGDSILEDAANQLDVMVRIAGNLQAQIDFICKEVAAALGLDVDTPAGAVQSVRSMMDAIELRDKRMAALWDYLNVLVLGKRYIKNDSQERHSWPEMAEWFDDAGEQK